jgi:hypothetical protein
MVYIPVKGLLITLKKNVKEPALAELLCCRTNSASYLRSYAIASAIGITTPAMVVYIDFNPYKGLLRFVCILL